MTGDLDPRIGELRNIIANLELAKRTRNWEIVEKQTTRIAELALGTQVPR